MSKNSLREQAAPFSSRRILSEDFEQRDQTIVLHNNGMQRTALRAAADAKPLGADNSVTLEAVIK